MNWKQHLKTVAITALTIIVIAGIAEAVGVWGYIFQPYSKLTGKTTVE